MVGLLVLSVDLAVVHTLATFQELPIKVMPADRVVLLLLVLVLTMFGLVAAVVALEVTVQMAQHRLAEMAAPELLGLRISRHLSQQHLVSLAPLLVVVAVAE